MHSNFTKVYILRISIHNNSAFVQVMAWCCQSIYSFHILSPKREFGIFSLQLTLWGRVTHICVSKLTIIGSDNGLSPDRRQAIIWTNAGLLLIGPLRTNFNEILIEILTFSFKKRRLKVSSAKRRPFCLGLNVLTSSIQQTSRKKNSLYSVVFDTDWFCHSGPLFTKR